MEVDSFDEGCVVDDGEDNVYAKGAGIVSVVAGTGGADLWDVDTDDPEAGYFVEWMGANSSDPRKGFVRFMVSGTEISAEFVGSTTSSRFTDGFTIGEPE